MTVIFKQRFDKERRLPPKLPQKLFSTNAKTGVSINFPVSLTCKPTKVCAAICYACRPGSFMMMDAPIQKSLGNYEYFIGTPTAIVGDRVAKEYKSLQVKLGLKVLRWNGVGDLFDQSVAVVNYMSKAHPDVHHLIYSRRPEMINKLIEADNISVLFSVDGSNTHRTSEITRKGTGYTFLRTSNDIPSHIPFDIVFPAHKSYKKIVEDERDCPCDRKKIPLKNACISCSMCAIATRGA